MREREAVDWIYGFHALEAALRRHPEILLEVWVAQGIEEGKREPKLSALLKRIEAQGVAIQRVAPKRLAQHLGEARHQGLAARVKRRQRESGEKGLMARLESLTEPALLLALDEVQDPHNLGACLRSADAVGADAVIIPRERAVGLTATVCKVAAGAAESVPLFQVANLARALNGLREQGISILGAAGEASESLYEQTLIGPTVLVMGSEEKGLRRIIREQCDRLVAIPMAGSVESLNISVAAAICLFEARRQRLAAGALRTE